MRIKAIIGKDEYIVAGQLLSDNKNTLKIKRVINILCAIGSACGAVIVLKKDLDVRAAVFSSVLRHFSYSLHSGTDRDGIQLEQRKK